MEIIIGKTAGFCFGVSNAVKKTEEELKNKKNVFCLGELVHNKQVTSELQNKGLTVIDNIEKAKQNVIIRAHGEPKETYKKAEKLELDVLDLTCPKVLRIHKIAQEYANNGFYILLIGQKDHPETIGTISYCGENSAVIEKEEDIEDALNNFYVANIDKLLLIAQTTFSLEKFNNIISLITEKVNIEQIELEIKRTICDATRLRQEETKEIAKNVDVMIIIGGKHSSNTNKLYEISKKYCKASILIETKEELNVQFVKKFQKIGIMAGASTPQKSIESVVEMLN
ncbi:MAG: 4-hydroxy-3-methylbut-2-enyl diphosphate reductase [Clostridia bacterium]|nr:4-hydroxy-3-methylbut-2-enyl diphosphate reductase [Clostridia bacterium]